MNNISTRFGRLNAIARLIDASSYLEIGVRKGATFNRVNVKNKHAVDPKFTFDYNLFQSESIKFFEVKSDKFFCDLWKSSIQYDLIFLDGLHVFEQTLRDLLNCLSFVHEESIILIDDTLPTHYAASQKMKSDQSFLRKSGDNIDNSWMGDVYKIVPFVHDFLPMYSYLTFPSHGQTVLFRKSRDVSNAIRFSGLEEISRLSFVEFLKLKDEGFYNICSTNNEVLEELKLYTAK